MKVIFMKAITPEDMLQRLVKRIRIWPTKPTIKVRGNGSRFGKLIFTVDGEDYVFSIYLWNIKEVYQMAKYAIDNHRELFRKMEN